MTRKLDHNCDPFSDQSQVQLPDLVPVIIDNLRVREPV